MSVKSTNDNQEISDRGFLSVIIPTYNESENIFKLLGEICKNTNQSNYEILVVDDNSPDGTGKLVEEFIEKNVPQISHNKKIVVR